MRVGIIGGGFSGVTVAMHLLNRASEASTITIVERANFGEGAAYGTLRREHTMNGPVSMMSCMPDDEEHLYEWLTEYGSEVGLPGPEARTHASFIPREVYSQYLKSNLERAEARSLGKLCRMNDEATEVHISDQNTVQVRLASGNDLEVGKLVLCLGFEPSLWPFPRGDAPPKRLIGNPWKTDYLEIPEDASILIVGTGLTFADAVVSFHEHGHKGKVTAISRKGIIPLPHDASGIRVAELHFEIKERTAWELYTEILEKIARHTSLGGHWQEAFNGIRPWIEKLWKCMNIEERKNFLQYGKSVWDHHRFRVPPEVYEVLRQSLNTGLLEVLTGYVDSVRKSEQGKVLARLLQANKDPVEQEFDFVINCTGPNSCVTNSTNTLMQNLLKKGYVLPGDTGIEIKISEEGRIVGKEGVSELIYALGPQLRDRDFEVTAVIDLRRNAKSTAEHILKIHSEI